MTAAARRGVTDRTPKEPPTVTTAPRPTPAAMTDAKSDATSDAIPGAEFIDVSLTSERR